MLEQFLQSCHGTIIATYLFGCGEIGGDCEMENEIDKKLKKHSGMKKQTDVVDRRARERRGFLFLFSNYFVVNFHHSCYIDK